MSEKDIVILTNDMKHMHEKMQELYDMLITHMKKEEEQMEKLLEKLDQKYATKWVEKVVGWAIWMVLVSVFSSLIYLVVKTH